MRTTALAAATALWLAGPALAQEPIATAPVAGPAAPQPTASPPALPSSGAAATQIQPVAMGPCGPEKVKPDGSLQTAPHGELDVGVGTNGYRHVGGAVCQPLGQDGAVAVSISQTQANGPRR